MNGIVFINTAKKNNLWKAATEREGAKEPRSRLAGWLGNGGRQEARIPEGVAASWDLVIHSPTVAMPDIGRDATTKESRVMGCQRRGKFRIRSGQGAHRRRSAGGLDGATEWCRDKKSAKDVSEVNRTAHRLTDTPNWYITGLL